MHELMGFHRISWDFTGFHGISQDFTGFPGISWDFMGFLLICNVIYGVYGVWDLYWIGGQFRDKDRLRMGLMVDNDGYYWKTHDG